MSYCLYTKCIGVNLLNSDIYNKPHDSLNATAEENCAALFCLLSHELRNPLSSVITTSNYILESYSLLSDQKKLALIEHISTNSKQLLEHLENTLSLSKIIDHSLVFTDESVADIIPMSVRRVRVKMPDFEMKVIIPPKMLTVSMDFVLIEHAFMLFFMHLWLQKDALHSLECNVEEKDNNVVFYTHAVPACSTNLQSGHSVPTVSSNQNGNASYSVKNYDKDLSICQLIMKAHNGTFHTVMTQNIPSYIITLPLQENR